VIQGNRIGTNAAGTAKVPNGWGGIFLSGSTDNLIGGDGADSFNFDKTYLSSNAGIDTVADFYRAQGDFIKVHSMDANTATLGDDDFKFIGTQAFHHIAGELHYVVEGANSIIQGDVNGDGTADFSIKVLGITSVTGSDFFL
jgi:serralysin